MAISNFLATKWSAKIELAAIENSVAAMVTSSAYQMEADGSQSVKINFVGSITIGAYTPGTDISVQALSDTQKILTMDQSNYFAFYADRQNLEQSSGNFMTSASEKAGLEMALKADDYVFGSATYGDSSIPAGNLISEIGDSIALTISNVEQYVSKMSTLLRKQHVNNGGFAVIPPELMDLIRRAGIGSLTENSELFSGRTVAKYAGLTLVESTQVVAAGTSADEFQVLAFSDRAIPMCVSLSEMSAVETEKRFGYTVKGLYVFGSKVLFPEEVIVMSCTIA